MNVTRLLEFLFGCRHSSLSRVFTIGSPTYHVCCECGVELDYFARTNGDSARAKAASRPLPVGEARGAAFVRRCEGLAMRKAVPVGRLYLDFGLSTLAQSDSPKKAITYWSNTMPKLLLTVLIILLPALVLAQSSSTSLAYQPATIVAVNPRPSAGNSNADDALYEVSVKVNRTLYVVVTKSPPPSGIIRYAVGRELLVRVGEDTITWNDTLGQSHDVPIISRSPFAGSFKSQD